MNAVIRVEDAQEQPGILTDKQAEFVRQYVLLGGQPTKAAELAGYSQPHSRAYELQRLPHVQAAIRAEQTRLVMEGGAKGLRWMVGALDDQKLAGAVRFQAAKWLAEAAGHGLAAQRANLGLPPTDKPLSEMTLDELDTFIAAGKRAVDTLKQDRERTIEGIAHNVAPDEERDQA